MAATLLLWTLSLGVSAYAVVVYALLPLGTTVDPGMRAGFAAHASAVYVHAFSAAVALLLGPLQFSTQFRARRTNVHRWLGRVYLGAGVLVGGLSGLYLAQFAYGGAVARLGFGTLAVLWLYTGARGFAAIRAGAVAAHRRWMTRNYALAFAAVMLRLYVTLSIAAGAEFEQVYAPIAWLCWVPNLLAAEYIVRRLEGEGADNAR
jgi:uncharacterized membrane protein